MQVQAEIVNQLGGNKFKMMTGASFVADGENTLIVKFKGSTLANIMYITLNALDLYNVRICKYRGLNVKDVDVSENVYSDMLCSIFEKATGLRTRL